MVNNGLQTTRLSRLQKNILRNLIGTDEFWGLPVTALAWQVAKETQIERDQNYVRKERRRQIIWRKAMTGEMEPEWAGYAMDRVTSDMLTAKFRASFSRSLKRLEDRGFILRIVDMKLKNHLWTSYTGDGRTKRIVFAEDGREWTKEYLAAAKSSS